MKSWRSMLFVLGALAFAVGDGLAATVYSGVDGCCNAPKNSISARAAWEAATPGFTTDTLDGTAGVPGYNADLKSSAGNRFRSDGENALNAGNWFSDPPILSPPFLDVSVRRPNDGVVGSFTWTLDRPSLGFGFNGKYVRGHLLTIAFSVDGSSRTYRLGTARSPEDRLFWGISGLASPVQEVSISFNNRIGYVGVVFDNFSVAPIPVPAALPLLGTACALLGLIGWRRAAAGGARQSGRSGH